MLPAVRPVALPRLFAVAVAALAGLNAIRLLRHAMWRDEIHAFSIAAASASPLELLHVLRYEAHPGLWYGLLWLLTRVTADPHAMQWLQLAIGLATWWIVVRYAPFTAIEKLLLLTSYFLFWEYFVLARGYGLGALLGVAALALRERTPEDSPLPWAALGLLANTTVFGALWSIGLAAGWAADRWPPRRPQLLAAAIYPVLLLAAGLTMVGAADRRFRPPDVPRDTGVLAEAAAFPRGAFVPQQLLRSAAPRPEPGGQRAQAPATGQAADPAVIAGRLLWVLAPVVIAPLILRSRRYAFEFFVVYVATLVLATVFGIHGFARHHGVLFLALVGAAWGARARAAAARPTAPWLAVLAIGALGGLASLGFDLRPYSRAGDVAECLREHRLADTFVIGWRDMPASTVAGHLGRSIYHLECECERRHVLWSTQRIEVVDDRDLAARLERALDRTSTGEAIVIVSHPRTLATTPPLQGLVVEPLALFDGALLREENFSLVRIRRLPGADRDPASANGPARRP